MWAFMEGWFTPSSLFIFLNLVIGTIVLTSRLSSPRKQPHHHLAPAPLARAPSLLDRVRSIDFSLYKFGHLAGGGGYPEPDTTGHEHDYARGVDAWPLARAPSLLDRFKSINFSLYKFDHHDGYPEPDAVQGSYVEEPQFSHREDSSAPPPPQPLSRAPSLVDRLKSFDFSLYKFQAPSYPQSHADHDEHSSGLGYGDGDEPRQLARAPSLLERVKSNFSSFYRSSEPDPDADALHHLEVDSDSEDDDDDDDDSVPYGDGGRVRRDNVVRRIRSEPKTAARGEAPARLPAKMNKSASERSVIQGEEEGEEIDAKADAFINRFKKDLKLQRLDSIMRYEDMLRRGAS